MKRFLETVLAILVSTGIIATILHYHYDKRLKTHDLRIEKYVSLIEELSRLTANEADWPKLRFELNAALSFASDDVVREILKFNDEFTRARSTRDPSAKFFSITGEQIKPLIIAIRKDLYLESNSLEEGELRFFQRETDQDPEFPSESNSDK